MSGVFDRLQKRMEIETQEGGISPLDLADLPPLLREHEAFYTEVLEWTERLPEDDRSARKDLDDALDMLTKQMWLIKRSEDERVRYQANLRRKAGSNIAAGIWSVLDEHIAALEKKEPPKVGGDE